MKLFIFWIHSCLRTDYDMTWEVTVYLQGSELAVWVSPRQSFDGLARPDLMHHQDLRDGPVEHSIRRHWTDGLSRDSWGPSERNELARFAIHNSGIVVVPKLRVMCPHYYYSRVSIAIPAQGAGGLTLYATIIYYAVLSRTQIHVRFNACTTHVKHVGKCVNSNAHPSGALVCQFGLCASD